MSRVLTLLAAGAITLAGCGGDDGGGSGGAAVTIAAGKPVEVKATEYEFTPGNIVVESAAGEADMLEITLANDGAVAHDLRVRRGDEELGGTAIFGPDQTKSARVTLESGTYEIFCSVGDHESLGMKGKLVVK
jgi:plastocyanin